jgi:hypothetical protein
MLEVLQIVAIFTWIPIGLAVVILCGGLEDAESDGLGVLIAVPLWPLVLLIGCVVWVWKKLRWRGALEQE